MLIYGFFRHYLIKYASEFSDYYLYTLTEILNGYIRPSMIVFNVVTCSLPVNVKQKLFNILRRSATITINVCLLVDKSVCFICTYLLIEVRLTYVQYWLFSECFT